MEKEKLKITFLSAYSGLSARGAETFVHEIANVLTLQGHSVTVYQGGAILTHARYQTVTVPGFSDLKHTANGFPFLNKSSLHIKKFTNRAFSLITETTDIVIPVNGQWQTLLTKWWCIRKHSKLVVSGQSGAGLDDRLNILCFPDQFIALSEYALRKAKTDNPFVTSSYIPNGVDTDLFTPKGEKFAHKLGLPVVLTVGAFVSEKRIDLVIKAVSKIPKASLLIVGEGPLKTELQQLAQTLLPLRHKFISIPHDQMPPVYRSADVFTLVPQPSESFGIVFAEALASNLPVVTIDDSTRREIIGSGGAFINDPENIEKYTESLQRALTMEWKNNPRQQGERLSWKTIADGYQKVFKKLISKK